MKRILSVILTATLIFTLCLLLASCNNESTTETKKDNESTTETTTESKKYSVGILQLAPHVALDAATEGFKQALIDNLGDNVSFEVQNAAGDPNTCASIASNFVSKNVDLIMANATPALQAVANTTMTIPILGTSVTEYGVALDIKNFNGTVGGNISGTSDLAPLDQQADMILSLFPEAKKVGLLYCSAEANSEYQVKVVEEYLKGKGITCTRFPFSDTNDVSAVTERAASESDVIYIPTDNTAATCANTIGSILRRTNTPAVAGEEGICAGCGVATLSISYYNLGYKTGLMAVDILKGTKNISEMPIEYVDNFTKKYNAEIAAEIGVTIPDEYVAIEK